MPEREKDLNDPLSKRREPPSGRNRDTRVQADGETKNKGLDIWQKEPEPRKREKRKIF